MRTYSKSLAIANRILGSESSKIYYTVSAQGAVHQNLVFGVINIIPEKSLQLHSIELSLQEASTSPITCKLVKINLDDLSSTTVEIDDALADIALTLDAGDRHVLQEISPHTLNSTYKYGLKITGATDPTAVAPNRGEGLSATYVLSYV